MAGSSCVDRGLSLVVSCFHHGDKCQRQHRTVYESLCEMKLLPHGGQEAGREERTRHILQRTPTPPGPVSSSLVSCELMLTSPSDQARALVTAPDGTTFPIQECLGDTSGSRELVLQMVVSCPRRLLELSWVLQEQQMLLSPGHPSAALAASLCGRALASYIT